MEYVIGPVLALLIGLKFTHHTGKKNQEALEALKSANEATTEAVIKLTTRVEAAETTIDVIDKQTLQKMVTTLQPVATSIRDIQSFVGMK